MPVEMRGEMRERERERESERAVGAESVQVLPAGGQGAASRVCGTADHLHPPGETRSS